MFSRVKCTICMSVANCPKMPSTGVSDTRTHSSRSRDGRCSRPRRLMHINIDPDGPCPCDSGKPASRCCFPHGELRPPPQCKNSPKLPRTGLSHPGCYASALQDCSTDLTGEHYVTRKLLMLLAGDENRISALGFPWWSTPKLLTPANLESRILCGRHNSALSGLDEIAGRFFEFILRATTTGTLAPPAMTSRLGFPVSRLTAGSLTRLTDGHSKSS